MTEDLLKAPERDAMEAVLEKTDAGVRPSFERLLGFVCGAVITPGGFEPSDWLQPMFGLNGIIFQDVRDIEPFMASLISLYDRVDAMRLRKENLCPFDLGDVQLIQAPQPVIDWAKGLHCAVTVQEDIWIPPEDEVDFVDDSLKKEVNLNIQCLTTLVDPASIPDIVKDPMPFQRNFLSQCLDWPEDKLSETWNEELLELFKYFCLSRLDMIMASLLRYAAAYDEGDVIVVDVSKL